MYCGISWLTLALNWRALFRQKFKLYIIPLTAKKVHRKEQSLAKANSHKGGRKGFSRCFYFPLLKYETLNLALRKLEQKQQQHFQIYEA